MIDSEKQMNILVLSAGTRNKIIQYFKNTLAGHGKVIATDMQTIAPAIYEADKYYIVPPITEPGYIDLILDICQKEEISGVLSLIDPELSLLAENTSRFDEIGVTIIGSDYVCCERALDKMQMYHWLKEHGYRCARSYDNKEEFFHDVDTGVLTFPVSPSQKLCKPPRWCRIEAPSWRFNYDKKESHTGRKRTQSQDP